MSEQFVVVVPNDVPEDWQPEGYNASVYPDDPGDVEGTEFLLAENPPEVSL